MTWNLHRIILPPQPRFLLLVLTDGEAVEAPRIRLFPHHPNHQPKSLCPLVDPPDPLSPLLDPRPNHPHPFPNVTRSQTIIW